MNDKHFLQAVVIAIAGATGAILLALGGWWKNHIDSNRLKRSARKEDWKEFFQAIMDDRKDLREQLKDLKKDMDGLAKKERDCQKENDELRANFHKMNIEFHKFKINCETKHKKDD